MSSESPLLSVENLRTYFHTAAGVVKAVDDVSFSLYKGKTLALVGESGCGKSVSALSIMRLIQPPGRIVSGTIRLESTDLLTISEKAMRRIRGNRISMIFQEPMTSLNPVYTIGNQIVEALQTHATLTNSEARQRAIELLAMVGIPSPHNRIKDYPHQLSGGMRQRVMIAMALTSGQQRLMIADEPTTALDVTIQAQILQLIRQLQQKNTMALLLITHDMGVVAQMADRIIVMYAGKMVEEADATSLFQNPLHPYTRGLLNSIPANPKYKNARRLESIPGTVPNLLTIGAGCPFQNRCTLAMPRCTERFPAVTIHEDDHKVHCYREGGRM